MKKLLCASLTAVMLFSNVVIANAQTTFIDVPAEHWAAPYIEEMAEAEFISGYEDKTFRPEKDVSYLEGIVLFARAMGSRSEAVSEILGYAVKEYGDIVDGYNLAFGKEEVCYMLYRGALTVDELNKYLASDVRNAPMKRYEAAIIITKALAAEKEAKSEILIDLSYKDAKDIPAGATNFVYYVTENGIMNGMEGNIFSPNTNVKRSQIAVMLSRTVGEMGLSFYDVNIKEIDVANSIIKTVDAEFQYTEKTIMCNAGKKTAVSDMPTGVKGIITVIRDEVCYVDTLYTEVEEKVDGVFLDYNKENDVYDITIKNSKTEQNETFSCDGNVNVLINGETAGLSDLIKGDAVKLTLINDKVTLVSAEQKAITIKNAVVSEIALEDKLVIKIDHSDEKYNGKSFKISSDVAVIKNDEAKTMSDILRGDNAELIIENDQVIKIVATSSKKSCEGIIKEIHIAPKTYLVVEINGENHTYDIPLSTSVKVNGEAATIYDFKLGDAANLIVESKVITAISVTSANDRVHSITAGVVTAAEASFGAIKVSYNNNGANEEETVVFKEGSNITATVLDSTGKSSDVKNIKVGDVVTVRGTMKNGIFIASVILIESK